MKIHCCFDIDYAIRHAREIAAAGIRKPDGELMAQEEWVANAVILKAKGFEVMPTCGNYDSRGYCKGHAE